MKYSTDQLDWAMKNPSGINSGIKSGDILAETILEQQGEINGLLKGGAEQELRIGVVYKLILEWREMLFDLKEFLKHIHASMSIFHIDDSLRFQRWIDATIRSAFHGSNTLDIRVEIAKVEKKIIGLAGQNDHGEDCVCETCCLIEKHRELTKKLENLG